MKEITLSLITLFLVAMVTTVELAHYHKNTLI